MLKALFYIAAALYALFAAGLGAMLGTIIVHGPTPTIPTGVVVIAMVLAYGISLYLFYLAEHSRR